MRVFIFFIFMAFSAIMGAQNSADPQFAIQAKAICTDNQVYLRWAPLNFATWNHGKNIGYDIAWTIKTVNGSDLSYEGQQQYLRTERIRPLEEGAWEPLAENNDLAGVAASCLYGDSLDVIAPQADLMTLYNVTQERETRFGFGLFAADRDFDIATLMGLGFKIDLAELIETFGSGLIISCTVTLADLEGQPCQNGYVEIDAAQSYNAPALKAVEALPGNLAMMLNWERNDEHFTAYRILRRPHGTTTWTNRTPYPLVYSAEPDVRGNGMFFLDSLPDNTAFFDYQIIGLSPFGKVGSASIQNVKGKPAPLKASMAVVDILETTPGQLTLNWEFPTGKQGNIQRFEVWRAVNSDSAYVKIASSLPVSARTFTDASPRPVNYYVVRAIDENDYELNTPAALGQPKDETPPVAPKSVKGTCDRTGLVRLSWPRSTSSDAMGYRVFISNVATGEFAQITSAWINDTTFQHSVNLHTLSRDMYFGVLALDYRHNQSGMTVVKILRPDIIPPIAPMLSKLTPLGAGIQLEWGLSPSADVSRYELHRLQVGTNQWTNIKTFPFNNTISAWTDSSAAKRTRYQYRLLAYDHAGNRSGSNILEGMRFNNGLRSALISLAGQWQNGAKGMVRLDWEYPFDEDLSGFVVYRSLRDTNRWNAHAFFPYPLILQSTTPGSPRVVKGANALACTWYDQDIDFNLFVRHAYTAGTTGNTIPNQSVPVPAPPSTPGGPTYTPGPSTKNYPPSGNPPVFIYYWVEAQFMDGSTSPIKGPIAVQIQ